MRARAAEARDWVSGSITKKTGEREQKWGAFQTDPVWISTRAETEKNGQIVENITSQFLAPTAFSAVK